MAKKKSETSSDKKIWWLAGDRYFTVAKKQTIIQILNKEQKWNIKDISDIKDSNDLVKSMFTKDLFDFQPTVFVYDGKHLPDAEACHQLIEDMGDKKALIIITSSVDGRTKFAKIFKQYLQEFEPVKDSRGFIDEDRRFLGMAKCRGLSQWAGDGMVFHLIAESSEYDYGCIINEIEKLRLYTLKHDDDITIEDYNEVGCIKISKQTDLLECIKKRNKIESINILYDLLEEFQARTDWVEVLHLLLETFDLFLFCKIIDPRGNGNEYAVGAKVSEIWLKRGEKVSPGAVGFRYGLERANIAKRDIDSITKSIAAINKSIMDLIYSQNIEHTSIMKSLIYQII